MLDLFRPRRVAIALACAFVAVGGGAAAQTRNGVDLELVLAVDVSGSMDVDEQQIQRDGYIQAFRNGAVLNAIRSGTFGRIAVTYVQWAGSPEQTVPWTIIANAKDAQDFAAAIQAAPLYSARGTSLSAAISFSTDLLESNPIAGLRKVIDISGDGVNNAGGPVVQARDAAFAKGITINGIPLLMNTNSLVPLDQYYRDCVIVGQGSFVIPVKTMDTFGGSIRAKLVSEIAGLAPPPGYGEPTLQLAQATQRPRTDCNERGNFSP